MLKNITFSKRYRHQHSAAHSNVVVISLYGLRSLWASVWPSNFVEKHKWRPQKTQKNCRKTPVKIVHINFESLQKCRKFTIWNLLNWRIFRKKIYRILCNLTFWKTLLSLFRERLRVWDCVTLTVSLCDCGKFWNLWLSESELQWVWHRTSKCTPCGGSSVFVKSTLIGCLSSSLLRETSQDENVHMTSEKNFILWSCPLTSKKWSINAILQ